jgi:hypothetical protein
MAQETQYCSLRYILGTVYSANTEASEISPGNHHVSEVEPRAADRGVCSKRSRFVALSIIRTDRRRLNHVADGEPLDGLVLGGASRAVGAPDGLDVAAACESTSQSMSVAGRRAAEGPGTQCSPFLLRPLFFLFLTILAVS